MRPAIRLATALAIGWLIAGSAAMGQCTNGMCAPSMPAVMAGPEWMFSQPQSFSPYGYAPQSFGGYYQPSFGGYYQQPVFGGYYAAPQTFVGCTGGSYQLSAPLYGGGYGGGYYQAGGLFGRRFNAGFSYCR